MQDKLRTVIVGCGEMSRRWLEVASTIPEIELTGFVDLNEDVARARAEQFGAPDAHIGTDFVSALDQLKPDIVFDCTTPEAHHAVTLAALEQGSHVLGEKPMANSMAQAREMVEAAQKSGKLYAVIQNRRYTSHIQRLKGLLASGQLGTLTTVNSDFYIGAHFGGFRDHMEHVLLLDMAIHTFDAARFLCGGDPVSVFCKEWNPTGSWYDYDAAAVAIFEMDNGVVYTYRGSWCAEGLPTSWESEWRIIGERGSVKWNGDSDIAAHIVDQTGGFLSSYREAAITDAISEDRSKGHESLIREFVHCVQNGETPETVCTDNIKSLAMVFGAIESAQKGCVVPVEW